ncbi:lytic transglycosylase domain-containing protein [Rhodoferax sp. AJA081-3]|uniref:lytic transglycosylase domain-containing protein n=1 Tax=Rhodoferax sp. AJA081-3 TaxID=2752316 RepID=UPI001ADEF0F9|nr:lytic transglycosylase domain-containing protein [Rhodoferax sp. AJA081-3]QTN30094.1 lytic transglycosylase domain-containing protein [Rhodoferax sp. AJA081-3]
MQFSAILTSIALLGATTVSTFAPAYAQNRDISRADSTLMDMAQSYKSRDRKRLIALLPQVRGHVLEPWAAYWDLSARLDEAGPTEIQEFFSRFSGSYQEDRLRAELLLHYGRNRDWVAFNREYPLYRMNDDKSVRCYALLAEHLSSGVDNTAQVKDAWLGLKEADDGCASAAEQLLKDHTTTAAMVWQRARLGMENDRLRVVTQAVGIVSPGSLSKLNAIYTNPGKYLNDKLTAFQPKTRELVSLALIRLATQDPEEAAAEINKLRWKTQLTDEERSWVWGVIGKRAAQRLSNGAADYFANGNAAAMHEDHLAWQVRAALRLGRWQQVLNAITAMPEAQRNDPTWVYWRARALLQQTQTEGARGQAQQLFESIASSRGFYEQLAQEELGQRISTPTKPAPLTAEEKEAARLNPGLNRALYAINMGLRAEGVREWNYSTNLHVRGGMDDRALLAAADMACRFEVWDRCINTSERTRQTIDAEQRFPMPFKAAVVARSSQIGLDPAYVYGLIRQESRFIMDAKSHVGASGLMQVMPATAKWTAKKIGLTNFQPHQINDRDTNIAIGTGYLKLVLDSFDGSMPLAAAAYNAGPGRPRSWRGQTGAPVMDAAIWAENVPFNETRDYVKKVLANTTNYAALITGQPQSLKARLGRIGPKDANTVDTGLDLP